MRDSMIIATEDDRMIGSCASDQTTTSTISSHFALTRLATLAGKSITGAGLGMAETSRSSART